MFSVLESYESERRDLMVISIGGEFSKFRQRGNQPSPCQEFLICQLESFTIGVFVNSFFNAQLKALESSGNVYIFGEELL